MLMLPLAFVSVAVVMAISMMIGFVLIMFLKQNPASEPIGWIDGERAEPGPIVAGLDHFENSREHQAILIERMGFEQVEFIEDLSGTHRFRGIIPTPVTGGAYLFDFVPQLDRPAVSTHHLIRLKRAVKRGDVIKGLLITTGVFTHPAREDADLLPIELIDGVRLRSLLLEHLPEAIEEEKTEG